MYNRSSCILNGVESTVDFTPTVTTELRLSEMEQNEEVSNCCHACSPFGHSTENSLTHSVTSCGACGKGAPESDAGDLDSDLLSLLMPKQ